MTNLYLVFVLFFKVTAWLSGYSLPLGKMSEFLMVPEIFQISLKPYLLSYSFKKGTRHFVYKFIRYLDNIQACSKCNRA